MNKTPTDNDVQYVCSLIEFIGRKTKNRNRDIVSVLGREGIAHQLKVAAVNHCLSFEQVSDELIEDYSIEMGEFDSTANCRYNVPTHLSIGKVYRNLIFDLKKEEDTLTDVLFTVFLSFISDEISRFDAGTYFENRSYIKACYEQGRMLE